MFSLDKDVFPSPLSKTVAGVNCSNGKECEKTNSGYSYCYVDDKYWDYCCEHADGCKFDAEVNKTQCDAGGGYTQECRIDPLTITLSGRSCAAGYSCGYYNYKYQWCWTKEDWSEWDWCCFVGSQCESNVVNNNHTITGCLACQRQLRSCGKGCTYSVCNPKVYPCNNEPVTRSINNYACLSPCSEKGTSYGWCWVKENEEAWDWCCAIGETCGNVMSKDKEPGTDRCYTQTGQGWPMNCIQGSEPSLLPTDLESPSAPFEGDAIVWLVFGLVTFAGFVFLGGLGCWRYKNQ